MDRRSGLEIKIQTCLTPKISGLTALVDSLPPHIVSIRFRIVGLTRYNDANRLGFKNVVSRSLAGFRGQIANRGEHLRITPNNFCLSPLPTRSQFRLETYSPRVTTPPPPLRPGNRCGPEHWRFKAIARYVSKRAQFVGMRMPASLQSSGIRSTSCNSGSLCPNLESSRRTLSLT
jgi:hypothetical protein